MTTWRSYVTEWLSEHQRSRSWLARNAGMSQPQLAGILNNHHQPMPATLLRLEQAMGLRPQKLVRLAVAEEQETRHG